MRVAERRSNGTHRAQLRLRLPEVGACGWPNREVQYLSMGKAAATASKYLVYPTVPSSKAAQLSRYLQLYNTKWKCVRQRWVRDKALTSCKGKSSVRQPHFGHRTSEFRFITLPSPSSQVLSGTLPTDPPRYNRPFHSPYSTYVPLTFMKPDDPSLRSPLSPPYPPGQSVP